MPWPNLTGLSLYQKKKNSVLLTAGTGDHSYMLKCVPSRDQVMCRALHVEATFFEDFHHPCIPCYYGIRDDFRIPAGLAGAADDGPYTAICMEYRPGIPLRTFSGDCSLSQLIDIVCQTGRTLFALLEAGIVYTDLNSNNILVRESGSSFDVTLLDFTCCYYYKIDPDPVYPLRFSYRLDSSLKGQQLLIQELSLLLLDLTASCSLKEDRQRLTSRLYALLITGSSPPQSLTLPGFLESLEQAVI